MHYDLVVIGSGPAGQKGAIAAAKLKKRVALIERKGQQVGGVCLHTGTVPSKTMREAILFLTGYQQRSVFADRYNCKRKITMRDLQHKLQQVISQERFVIRDQLERNGIDVYEGEARFVDPHCVEIHGPKGTEAISGEHILIASGTRPSRPAHIPFDGQRIFDSDEILNLKEIPRSMIVVGGGVIGIEYAIMFAALGVKVTVVDGRPRLLEFCDQEVVDTLMYTSRSMGITFRLGENVDSIQDAADRQVVVILESQKRIIADAAFFSVGRVGDTDALQPTNAGLDVGPRGKLECDERFRTTAPHIFAVGDVIGFPSLASTSMEQGRRAIHEIYQLEYQPTEHIPYGLFTIPEIAMVGKTEQQLTQSREPYEIGVARFCELAKSQISGCHDGMLKLLFHRETLRLLGVHSIGEAATEIVHIGQAVMALGGTIEYFCNQVFNHPTIAESYKVAAFDGLNRLCRPTCHQSATPSSHSCAHGTAADQGPVIDSLSSSAN